MRYQIFFTNTAPMKKYALLFFFIVILIVPFTKAIGVSLPYMENKTLLLLKDHYKLIEFTLQNGDALDVEAVFTVESDIGYVIKPQTTYLLPAKTYDTKIIMNLTDPPKSKPGDIYTVSYSLVPIVTPSGGLTMKTKIDRSFFVQIVETLPQTWQWSGEAPDTEEPNTLARPLLVTVSILLLLGILFWKRSQIIAHTIGRIKK